jgi:8-oxo-dGTP pyrophosphatase MutT (NUDIX family)
VENFKRLSRRQPRIQNEDEYFVSAVLLPIVRRGGQPNVLFEVRANHLHRQPGEICFPGGKVEEDEKNRPQDAAIREAVEELGISREQVVLIGPLDYLVTPPGTLIYPYLGMLEDYDNIAPNPDEVDEIFLVPVDHFLMNPPSRSRVEVATRYDRDFPFHRVPPSYKEGWQRRWTFSVYFYEYGDHFIWGMTARILYNFISLCWPEHVIE